MKRECLGGVLVVTEAIMVHWGGLMVMVKRFEVQFAHLLTTRQAWKQVLNKKRNITS